MKSIVYVSFMSTGCVLNPLKEMEASHRRSVLALWPFTPSFFLPSTSVKATWIFLMLIYICWSRSNGMAIADCSSRTNTGSQYIYHHHLSFSPSDTPAPLCFLLSILILSFPSLHTWNQAAGAFFKTESFWTILASKHSGSKRHALWSWHGPSSLAGLWGG